MYYPYYYSDGGLLLLALAVMVLGFIAQARVNSAFKKYSQVRASAGIPAVQAAKELLYRGGSAAVVTEVGGSLTDHYNPKTNTVGLSRAVYHETSVAALAIAAHEIGHVMQYEEGYGPIRLRNTLLPVANFGSRAAPFIVLIGVLMGSFGMAMLGVYLFGAMFLFQLFTLPVEFNASRRAIEMLTSGGYLAYEEVPQAKKVLRAAAMTYVVAALASLVNLFRLFLIAKNSRRR